MRRTTICRSSAAVTAALLFGVAAAPAAAQQPPAAGPGQQPAQAPVAPPASYIVQQGETLWLLAQRFFGDPLLWPEIYRLNTNVIEDPHWIFPGEELRLAPAEPAPGAPAPAGEAITVTPRGDTVRSAPVAQQPAPPTTIFAGNVGTQVRAGEAIELRSQRAYRAVREGEYFSAGFLTENQQLNTGRMLGNSQSSSIRRLSSSSSAQLFGEVLVRPPAGEQLARGDLLLVFRRAGEVRGFGEVIRPSGLLLVLGPAETGNVSAQVVRMYGQITDGQEVLKTAPFSWDNSRRAAEVADGVAGEVISLRDSRELVALQGIVFLNRGADDGVRLGDVFAISGTTSERAGTGTVVQDQARVLIVNTRSHTSSAVIVELYRPDVRAGSAARQVRRMPS